MPSLCLFLRRINFIINPATSSVSYKEEKKKEIMLPRRSKRVEYRKRGGRGRKPNQKTGWDGSIIQARGCTVHLVGKIADEKRGKLVCDIDAND